MFIFMVMVGCIETDLAGLRGEEDLASGIEYVAAADDPPGEGSDRAWLYEPTVIRDFFIDMSDDARTSLAADPAADVPVVFTYDDRAYEVALHLRGKYTFRTLDSKPSFKIDFHEYDPDQTFDGVRRLTLTNMIQDGSMLRAEAAYYLFRAAGVPAPRHGYARVWVNGEWHGLFGVVETLDEQFLAEHFASNDGNLYAGGYGADIIAGRTALFELEEDSGDGGIPPYTDLDDLITAFAGDGDFMDIVDAHFDTDTLLRFFAVEMVSGQADGYLTYANNYVLYFDPAAERWTMMPWGADQAFVIHDDDPLQEWYGQLAIRCSQDGRCRERYLAHVSDVLDIWEESGFMQHVLEVKSAIVHDCEVDPRRELPCAWDQDSLIEYLQERPGGVRSDF